ncbi:hypothetical protein SAMN05421810_1185 [Amycolatopsis arida]|uniref:Uncharacterized protein n=1 Tax=Amycolatopsis arida TaxID=587909 RepID=A0A1I6B0H5_9PSEU|nr:hypothetical protein CLV69_11925 [Amycolatopsis arida]SFQ74430.1 hypothetical protein SAMN05421810_1185 [Amycolatopsis arida]
MEAEIGHRFRNDMSMSDIIAAAATSSPVNPESPEHAAVVELGRGQLWWPRFERQTDRYGTVLLCTGPDGEDYASFESAPVGTRGQLVAVVLETRPSVHCGDLARGLAPTTPAVGEEITLGAGTVFTETDPDTGRPTAIGMAPDDGRDEDWLDPRALYRCHNQTVRLEFRAARHAEFRRSEDPPHAA